MMTTLPWKKYIKKKNYEFHKSLLNKIHSLYICSYLGNSTFTSLVAVFTAWKSSHFCRLISFVTLKTLKLCAVAEGVWHDNVFIEVVWMSIAITLDLINDLVDRDDWCLISISMGQFWQGLVHGSIVWMIHFCWRNAHRRHYLCGYSFWNRW